MKIAHVITDLAVGGAEMALYKLLSALDLQEFQSGVIALAGEETMGEKIRAMGVPVTALGSKRGIPDPRLLTRLRKELLRFQPDLVQTWMYHADLLGGLAAKLAGSPPVVWNIRHSLVHPRDVKRTTLLVARANSALSSWVPQRIVCCARAALESHAALGYARQKMIIIHNGFDLELFQPDQDARREVRASLGMQAETPLIGMCARFDPQKDHHSFVRAAGALHRLFPTAHYILWGKGVDRENPQLLEWIAEQDLGESVHLLGPRVDTPRLDAALDISTLSAAYGEAFPNVIGEAMACGVPCAVTDVGDSAYVVGSTGRIVPPGAPRALASAWADLLNLAPKQRFELGQRARQRVADYFGIAQMAKSYAALYRDIISSQTRA
jgi:glycosyltransferase involved in cell wall biosynthesis